MAVVQSVVAVVRQRSTMQTNTPPSPRGCASAGASGRLRARPVQRQRELDETHMCHDSCAKGGDDHEFNGSEDSGVCLAQFIGAWPMAHDHPAIAYCKRDLEVFRKLLANYKAGRHKSGNSTDGITWTDATPEQIVFLEGKISELTDILEAKKPT